METKTQEREAPATPVTVSEYTMMAAAPRSSSTELKFKNISKKASLEILKNKELLGWPFSTIVKTLGETLASHIGGARVNPSSSPSSSFLFMCIYEGRGWFQRIGILAMHV